MLSSLLFWKRPVDPFIEHEVISFPVSILQILMAQSASVEVRRHIEFEGNVFETIKVNRELQCAFIDSYMQANLNYFQVIKPISVDSSDFSTAGFAPTGFNERDVFTASLKQSTRFLRLNGVSNDEIVLCEVGAWKIRNCGPFDLIFSRMFRGFHYLLTEYLAEAARSLSKHGVVITDVRAGQGGEALLHEHFDHVGVLEQGRKSALMTAYDSRVLL